MTVGRTLRGEFDPSNPVRSFLDTVRRVVTQPAAFFAGLPRQGALTIPLIFALVCFLINAVFSGILELAGVEVNHWFLRVAEEGNFFERFVEFVGTLVLTPILGGIGVLIGAGILQLLTRLIVGPQNAGYRASFRVTA